MAKIRGKPSTKIRNVDRVPKHITEISMTPEQYIELRSYLRSMILPGTPPFECRRLSINGNKQIYRQWLTGVLEDIGPRFFPRDGNGLVWPEDHDSIYRNIHQVVRAQSIGIWRNYEKGGLRATPEKADNDKMDVARGGDLCQSKDVGDTGDAHGKGDDMVLDENESYAQCAREDRMTALMAVMDQEDRGDDTMEESMDAEPFELEDLLGLMKPEVFAHFPNLADEYFDWDEIEDPKCPEPIARLLLLLS